MTILLKNYLICIKYLFSDEEASKWLMALTELYKKYGDQAGAKGI
jgi:hypothetical protein